MTVGAGRRGAGPSGHPWCQGYARGVPEPPVRVGTGVSLWLRTDVRLVLSTCAQLSTEATRLSKLSDPPPSVGSWPRLDDLSQE
ncbi:hypothetical protein FMEAI12_2860002 [Parafrankia sp. Ea1.12]|nr:hypothetical protein FMEAI12_2860002 [Parafrankia sp. Ea1.12]